MTWRFRSIPIRHPDGPLPTGPGGPASRRRRRLPSPVRVCFLSHSEAADLCTCRACTDSCRHAALPPSSGTASGLAGPGPARRIGGLFDAGGTLRIYTRPDGAEVVRLTVVNLSPASVDELKAGFGVGSRLGQPNVDGRGLTWSVGGRWACQHVMLAIRPYLEESSPLRTALWRLLTTGPIPPRTECDVDDCAAPVRARALCGPHCVPPSACTWSARRHTATARAARYAPTGTRSATSTRRCTCAGVAALR